MKNKNHIDVLESAMDEKVLKILLSDKTTKKNIIWATNDYTKFGKAYEFHSYITPKLITGKNEKIIKPRADKELYIQQMRSKEKAEVFTPSWVCNVQNNLIDNTWFGNDSKRFNTEKEKSWETNYRKIKFSKNKSWEDYIFETRLEISCGEAPYLVSRYDTVTGKYIPVKRRIGILDRKIRVVSENTETESDWEKWTLKALQSVYGFEWQGDNVLLARENLLYTVIESYYDKFQKKPDDEFVLKCAKIISWNIWQMDGIKFVIPESCHDEEQEQINFFGFYETKSECPGCKHNKPFEHTGIYAKIKDWEKNKIIRFADMMKGGNFYG